MPDRPSVPDGLEDRIRAYEAVRRARGLGGDRWRITPTQWADVISVAGALANRGGPTVGRADGAFWTRYLAPILAETPEARSLLAEALEPSEPVPPLRRPAWRRALAAFRRHGRTITVASLTVLALAVLGTALIEEFLGSEALVCTNCVDQSQTAAAPITSNPVPDQTSSAAVMAYRQAMTAAMAAIRDQQSSGTTPTPREMAAVQAHPGVSGAWRLGSADTVLATMLAAWPEPADRPIPADASGAASVRREAAAVAAAGAGLPLALFEPLVLDDGVLPAGLRNALRQFASGSPGATQAERRPAAATWPSLVLPVLGLPIVVYVIWALGTLRSALRGAERLADRRIGGFTRNRQKEVAGVRRDSAPLAPTLVAPILPRASLKGVTRYEPVPGRRLNGKRSIAATIASEGAAGPTMWNVRRIVHYVVLVSMRQPDDHERHRVRRFFEAVRSAGVPIHAYDYETDPLLLNRTTVARRTEPDGSTVPVVEKLDLSTLRDLHRQARLILVTDGRDIVDTFTGHVRERVAAAIRLWDERMVLTPVPVGDWGAVEYAMSLDLDAPLGRSTTGALDDIRAGFDVTRARSRFRTALGRAAITPRPAAKVTAWWLDARKPFGAAAQERRGPHLPFDDPRLVTDVPPAPDEVRLIIGALVRWLGMRGAAWLGACAIYPVLRYDLTLHLGQTLREWGMAEGEPLFKPGDPGSEVIFERLTALPWFRVGRMPDWLREKVFRRLEPSEQDAARGAIADLFGPEIKATSHGERLPVWWPRAGMLTIPSDAVMLQLLTPDEDDPGWQMGEPARDAVVAAERRSVVARRLALGVLLALWCVAAGWAAPTLRDAPHAAGAWFPLAAVVVTGLASLIVVIRWARRERRHTARRSLAVRASAIATPRAMGIAS